MQAKKPDYGYCEVKSEGAIIVNSCTIYKRTKDIILLNIDCKSKYFDVGFYGWSDEGPAIGLDATERTIGKDETRGDETTSIIFPKFKGFEVFGTTAGRYSVNVCLVRKPIINHAN